MPRWLIVWLLLAAPAWAMTGSGPVVDWDRSRIVDTWGGGMLLDLALSEPAPFAVGMASGPDRLELVLVPGLGGQGDAGRARRTRRAGMPEIAGGTLRLPLLRPMTLSQAQMTGTGPQTRLWLRLEPAEDADFAAAVSLWSARVAAPPVPAPDAGGDAFLVMIDPGHGGLDPGAEHGGYREADLVLMIAEALARELRAAGMAVALTRSGDEFVPLPERLARANRARAGVFVSLHADALRAGRATGASVHVLSDGTDPAADRYLLERLGADAVGAGTGDDMVALALMETARARTVARSGVLAETLLDAFRDADIALYKTPLKRSNFVVLRAADMPSVLVELGFLSEPADRARLIDPGWRARVAHAMARALTHWAAMPR